MGLLILNFQKFTRITNIMSRIILICFIIMMIFHSTRATTNIWPTRVRTVEELDKNHTILDFIGLVEQYEGYTAEEYNVTTKDGYNLILHRITGSPRSPKSTDKKPVVFLQHGFLASSDMWVFAGLNKSLALQLADEGYDVFLGNVRGNTYSRFHIQFSPDDVDKRKFWDFGLDEIAAFDLPALIDFALNKSMQEKLTYIGFSMGTSLSYMLLSEKPEYNEKINLLISLSPVAFFTYRSSILFDQLFAISTVAALDFLNIHEILPLTNENILSYKNRCTDVNFNSCRLMLNFLVDTDQLDFAIIPQLVTYFPAGTSLRTIKQFIQIIHSGKFQKYNYNPFGCLLGAYFCNNVDHYGEFLPPEYDLSLVKVPTVLIFSANDFVVQEQDVLNLKEELGNVISVVKIPNEKFNHMDFVLSTEVKRLVNDEVVKIIKANLIDEA